VKVLDLGLGALVDQALLSGDGFDTGEGVVVGTTDFMSPEQIQDQPIDVRTDLFSLGCTMYRLLAGTYAFPGLTREDRLVKRIRQEPVPITDVRPDIPPVLARIVDRLLALRPEDRFGSAVETAEALEALNRSAGRSGRDSGAGSAARRPDADVTSLHTEPEAPLDWSLIESALRPTPNRAREAEGLESGREVHEKYRNELIQMNRVRAELETMAPKDDAPDAAESWLERLGEKIGDSLAEPSAGLILVGILAVFLVLALALAFAIG
jgi:serine/threonine protein kinase